MEGIMKPLSRTYLCFLLALTPLLVAQMPQKQVKTSAPEAKKSTAVPAKKTAPRMMTLLVTTDMTCSFIVNGKLMADLNVGEQKKVSLSLREHKLEAVSSSASQDRWEIIIDLSRPGAKSEINVELLPIQAKRLEEERKASEAKAEEERKAAASRITAKIDGREYEVKRIQSFSVSEGEWANGVTVRSRFSVLTYRGSMVNTAGELYSQHPSDPKGGWFPINDAGLFAIIEIQATGLRSAVIRSGDKTFPAALVDKGGMALIAVPQQLIPCTLELSR
jgi:hypothetical protein